MNLVKCAKCGEEYEDDDDEIGDYDDFCTICETELYLNRGKLKNLTVKEKIGYSHYLFLKMMNKEIANKNESLVKEKMIILFFFNCDFTIDEFEEQFLCFFNHKTDLALKIVLHKLVKKLQQLKYVTTYIENKKTKYKLLDKAKNFFNRKINKLNLKEEDIEFFTIK